VSSAVDSVQDEEKGRWFAYFVTITIGLAFSLTLLSITWNNAIERNKKEFALESFSLRESVTRNVRSAHNVTNNFTAFFKATPDLNNKQFSVFTDTMLQQHEFIEGAIYFPVLTEHDDSISANEGNIPPFFQLMRDKSYVQEGIDLYNGIYRNALASILKSGEVLTLAGEGNELEGKKYWMFKVLDVDNVISKDVDEITNNNRALIGVLVDSAKLFDSSVTSTGLALTIFSNASSLSARQLLYQKESIKEDNGWAVALLEEEGMTQFPSYSIKLNIKKELDWQEVDKELVFNALLIGVGVTLLIIALVRAKDQQSRELKQRNIVIERQVAEQTKELALTRDQALEASRVKSEFLASMSHEIRTPLNAIIGMSSLLEETPLNTEQKNYISVFKKAGDTLLSLVNDILDLSKIEAQQLVLENISFNLLETVEESVEIYALKAAENDVELLCHMDEEISINRMGDSARLRQIILNLISNALKFTEQGEVVVRVSEEPNDKNGETLRFSVSDSGIGIPAAKLDAIFASFTQVDSSTTRKYGGTGLGLSISRSLSEMMGGRIWVESEEGKGSNFCFTAKLEAVETEELEATNNTLTGIKVLIVDDNAVFRDIIKSKLLANGVIVHEAGDAEQVNKLFKNKDEIKPDIILVDFKMPTMNGFEFIEELKSRGLSSKLIMMLGAADLNHNMSRIKEAGIDAYLIKPIKRSELIQQLEFVQSGKTSTSSAGSKTASENADLKPLKILLVEDNPDNRLLIKAYLKKLPYELVEAENGQIAVESFQQSDFDLVLMDVQMPIMDGHEATRTIRAWESENSKKATPIISLTAHAFKEEIDKCLEAGCNTHLSKPVKKAVLISTIQEYTDNTEV
jgi:signal transduction histidine kinase/DNA-binding response OmpR family regulator